MMNTLCYEWNEEEMDDYKENNYSEWSLYDSIVQSYRSNMISSQTLLLAVAALFYEKQEFLVIIICIIGLIIQWFVWHRIIRSRSIISDYHKFNSKFNFSRKVNNKGEKWKKGDDYLTESTYVSNRRVRKKANGCLATYTGEKKYKSNYRITRIKIDIIIPVLFTIIWISILVFSILSVFNCK